MRPRPASPTAGRSRYDPRPAPPTSPIATAMVGVGRDLSPDTGTGGELYAVIGHAPRHLDRNIALVGRIVSGIEHMSACRAAPRRWASTRSGASDVPIVGVQLGVGHAAGRAARGSNISIGRLVRCLSAMRAKTGRTISSFVPPAGWICATATCRSGRCPVEALGGPGGRLTRLRCWMIRAVVRSHARLGQRQGRRAEGAFGRHPADQPWVRPQPGQWLTSCSR